MNGHTVSDLLYKVPAADIRLFLENQGWEFINKGEFFIVFSPQDQKGFALKFLVPTSPTLSDFEKRWEDLIRGVASYYNADLDDMLTQLLDLNQNAFFVEQPSLVFRLRRNSVPIRNLSRMIERLRETIAYSLSSELADPEPVRNKPLGNALDRANRFEFGQTMKGSFIGIVRAPGEAYAQTSFIERSETIEEKALARIALGMQWISQQNFETRSEEIKNSFEFGFNANMAEQMKHLIEEAEINSIDFSIGIPRFIARQHNVQSQIFSLDETFYRKLAILEEILTDAPEHTQTITAKITKLESHDPQQEKMLHRIHIKSLVGQQAGSDYSKKHFSTTLFKNDYQLALQAHGRGQVVTVEGIFKKVGNKLTLTRIVEMRFS